MQEFILLSMIFLHVVADFNLQGILATFKQSKYWQEHVGGELDFIPALLAHSFSWTFLIMLPIAIYSHFIISETFLLLFLINIILHAFIDHLKANRHAITLCTDQGLHYIQIALTWLILGIL